MVIAVDFDGTIVTNEFPNIGTEIPFATDVLRKILSEGKYKLILWTSREGERQREAIEWCNQRGIYFYAVNKNHPDETVEDEMYSKKIRATYYIDDHNFPGGTPDWRKIDSFLHSDDGMEIMDQQWFQIKTEENFFVRFGRWVEKIKRKLNRYC